MVAYSEESPYVANILWLVELLNRSHFVRVWVDSISVDDLSEELHLCLGEMAFLFVQCQPCFLKSLKDFLPALVMFLTGLSMDQDIIHHTHHTIEVGEYLGHPPLKMLRRRSDAEWQAVKAIPAKRCDERCQQCTLLVQWDLPEP